MLRDRMTRTRTVTTAARPVRRLTEELLADVQGVHRAVISATEPGVAAGLEALQQLTSDGQLGQCTLTAEEGELVPVGGVIAELVGTASQLAAAEDAVLGPFSGLLVASPAVADIIERRPEGLRIVCGGWKKLPGPLKPLLRSGLAVGGVDPRLAAGEFVYVDKNVVTLSGGVAAAVAAARRLEHGPVAVQIATPEAALVAARAGAGIIMVMTPESWRICVRSIRRCAQRIS